MPSTVADEIRARGIHDAADVLTVTILDLISERDALQAELDHLRRNRG